MSEGERDKDAIVAVPHRISPANCKSSRWIRFLNLRSPVDKASQFSGAQQTISSRCAHQNARSGLFRVAESPLFLTLYCSREGSFVREILGRGFPPSVQSIRPGHPHELPAPKDLQN